MPAIVALPAFWGAVTAAAAGTAGIVGAKISSGAADDAATTQAAAANHAADLQAQASAQSLAFQKEAAENAYQNNEASRQGNYGQFAAGQTRLKSVGESLGIPGASGMEIPAYVPGVDPNLGGPSMPSVGQAAGAPASGQPSSGNPMDPAYIESQVRAAMQQAGITPGGPGSGPGDVAYYVKRVGETGGWNAAAPSYWGGPQGRITLGGAQPGQASAATSAPGSVGAYTTPYVPVAAAPPLNMPAPGSVGSYVR